MSENFMLYFFACYSSKVQRVDYVIEIWERENLYYQSLCIEVSC